MSIYEYNEEKVMQALREEARDKGTWALSGKAGTKCTSPCLDKANIDSKTTKTDQCIEKLDIKM